MSLLLLASMPDASPDGPSDEEEESMPHGKMGKRKGPHTWTCRRPSLRVVATASSFLSGLGSRADRLLLPLLLKAERPIEQGRGCGLWLSAPALGFRRLLGHELGPGERVRCLPTHRHCHVTDAQRAPLLLRSTHGAFRPTATPFPQSDVIHRHGGTGRSPRRGPRDCPLSPDRPAGRWHRRARQSRHRTPAFEPEILPDRASLSEQPPRGQTGRIEPRSPDGSPRRTHSQRLERLSLRPLGHPGRSAPCTLAGSSRLRHGSCGTGRSFTTRRSALAL